MFSKIMQAFKLKRMSTKLETPSTFTWGQSELPVKLGLSNRSTDPRIITKVLFEIREKQEAETSPQDQDWSSGNTIHYEHDVGITLEPGEVQSLDVVIPTSLDSFAAAGAELPQWMSLAGKAIDAAQKLQRKSPWFEVRASTYLEDFRSPVQTTRTIGSGLRFGR